MRRASVLATTVACVALTAPLALFAPAGSHPAAGAPATTPADDPAVQVVPASVPLTVSAPERVDLAVIAASEGITVDEAVARYGGQVAFG